MYISETSDSIIKGTHFCSFWIKIIVENEFYPNQKRNFFLKGFGNFLWNDKFQEELELRLRDSILELSSITTRRKQEKNS